MPTEAELAGVSRTCLGTLMARARESTRPGGILRDPKAEEISRQIEFDATDLDWPEYQLFVAVRTELIDAATTRFLAGHPNGVVVDLGAGLDTRFDRLDNGSVRWYELDLPPVIQLRERLFPNHERRRNLALSVLDPRWPDEVPSGKPVLFLLEGLVNYLDEEQARGVVRTVARRFPQAEIVMEVLGLFYVRLAGSPLLKWGVCAENHPGTWDPRLQLVHWWNVTDRHPARWREIPWLTPLLLFGSNVQMVLHLCVRT